MATLPYVGRSPDSDSSVMTKVATDNLQATLVVDTNYVNSCVANEAIPLVLPSYVDAGDATRAHKTDVDAADATYLAASTLGANSGVGSLDSSGNLVAAQVPTGVVTDRVVKSYNVTDSGIGTLNLTSGNTHSVTTTTLREYQLGKIVIPDPGYPYRPLPFAYVQGMATGTDPATRTAGNGNYGMLSVLPPAGVSDRVYGVAVCTANYNQLTWATVVPYGTTNDTPTAIPAVTGSLELGLYGCMWSGNSYQFSGTGLVYYVLIFPAM